MVARAGGNWAGTGSQEAGGAPEATAIPGATKDICQLDPKNRYPWQKAALGMQPGVRWTPPAQYDPRGRWTPPALCNLSGRSHLKIKVWTPVQK